MWKTLETGAKQRYGDQIWNGIGAFVPIPSESIGKPVPEGATVQRFVKPAGRKPRNGEVGTRITIRIPKTLAASIPGRRCTWAADVVIRELRKGVVSA